MFPMKGNNKEKSNIIQGLEELKNYGRMLTKQRSECVESVFAVRHRQFNECQSLIWAVHTNRAVVCYVRLGSGGECRAKGH